MVFAQDGEIVSPGQPICVEEEFLPGENTKLHGDGVVASITYGRVRYDRRARKVKVEPLKPVEEVRVGDTVLAEVKEVQDKIAVVEIISVDGRPLKHPRTAFILPAPRMRGTMDEYVGVGDLVVAVVINIFAGVIGLTIWRQGLGAIYSLCDSCGGLLKRTQKGLVCTRCGKREKRKIVHYYGNMARLASMVG